MQNKRTDGNRVLCRSTPKIAITRHIPSAFPYYIKITYLSRFRLNEKISRSRKTGDRLIVSTVLITVTVSARSVLRLHISSDRVRLQLNADNTSSCIRRRTQFCKSFISKETYNSISNKLN